jgi:hypothetical protein
LDVIKRAENLADVIEKQKSVDFKSLDEYESKLAEGETESKSEGETGTEEKNGEPIITSEAELQKMKKYLT